MTETSAFDLGLALAAQLRQRKIPYALGGALALGAAGLPRGTLDVDVNVFVEPDQLGPVFDAMRALGATVDEAKLTEDARREGLSCSWIGGLRVDVFVPSIPFSWEAQRSLRVIETPEGPVAFLSAEALAVFKLLFFRTKDLGDLEQLVAIRPDLDRGYIRTKLVEMMGEDDERVRAWDEIVIRMRPPPSPS